MLHLVALSALLYLAAAQSDPTVQVNGGGVNPSSATPSSLRGVYNSQMGGEPISVNGNLQTPAGSTQGTLGGTALLETPTVSTVLGGTASIGSTPTPSSTTTLGGTVSLAAAVGDPEIRGFDGNNFEFDGEAGSFYEALGGSDHQLQPLVSVDLKLGVMYDHNGTYIQGIGVRIHGHKFVVKLDAHDKLQVLADSVPLVITTDEPALNETLGAGAEAAHIDWQMFRPKYGNSVEISSALLTTRVYVTDAGVLDKGGMPQPAYLNFELALNSVPKGPLKGFMGETYNRVVENYQQRKLRIVEKPSSYHDNPEMYSLPGFFT